MHSGGELALVARLPVLLLAVADVGDGETGHRARKRWSQRPLNEFHISGQVSLSDETRPRVRSVGVPAPRELPVVPPRALTRTTS